MKFSDYCSFWMGSYVVTSRFGGNWGYEEFYGGMCRYTDMVITATDGGDGGSSDSFGLLKPAYS